MSERMARDFDRRDQEALRFLPPLQVGSLVKAVRRSGVCDPGERGVVCEAYELAGRPGWSVIFESGRHDGFSPGDVSFFLEVTGEVCDELAGYEFRNVYQLSRDFAAGVFAPVFGPDASREIFNRWFSPGEAQGSDDRS